jgi:hypothetical protein
MSTTERLRCRSRRDELQFNIRLSERVSVEFAFLKQDDGRYGVPYKQRDLG